MWVVKVFAILLAFFLLGLLFSSFPMKAAQYGIDDSRIEQPVTLVFLSDLHIDGPVRNRERLIRKIADQKPDVIALVGDLIDDAIAAPDIRHLVEFAAELKQIAPVYYSFGNHELAYFRKNGRSVLDSVKAAGITVLDETFQDILVKGNPIRIGGLYANAYRQDSSASAWLGTSRFLRQFESTEQFKVLLCHRPDSFIFNNASLAWDIGLVLSGHTHGGLVRLPLAGGLFAAGQGLFPKYDYGFHELGGMKMIITSGLSGYRNLPRVWNRPEIAVVRLSGGNG